MIWRRVPRSAAATRRRPVLALVAAGLVASAMGPVAAPAAGSGSRLIRADTFDTTLPGAVPAGWVDASAGNGYRAIPDVTAPSLPETVAAAAGPAAAAATRGLRYNGPRSRNIILQASVRILAVGGDDRGAALVVRASNDLRTGIAAAIKPATNRLTLERRTPTQATVLAEAPLVGTGDWRTIAVEAYGTALRAKSWTGAAEPSGWQVTASDVTPADGYLGIADGGSAARFDNVMQFDPVAGTIVAPPAPSDGTASPVTVSLYDDGLPAAGRTVSLTSDRDSVDVVSPAQAVIAADGRAIFTLASTSPGVAKLTLSVDEAPVNITGTVAVGTGSPVVGTEYRQTFDVATGALPSGWTQRATSNAPNFVTEPAGGVAPSAGVLADRTATTTQRETAYYQAETFGDATIEAHAVMPREVTHGSRTLGVSARITADGASMYTALLLLDDPRAGDTTLHKLVVLRRTASVDTVIATNTAVTSRVGEWTRLKMETVGPGPVAIRVKVWPARNPEPAGWTIVATDPAATLGGPGYAGVTVQGGGGALLDNFTVSPPGDAVRTDPLPKTGSAFNAYAVIANPVRGPDLARGNALSALPGYGGYQDGWTAQEHLDFSKNEAAALAETLLPGSWLARYDAIADASFLAFLRGRPPTDEIGMYLEVTPVWARDAGVDYHLRQNGSWIEANALFLTGYTQAERIELIDTAMAKFHAAFGSYPKSVGAFWIDAYSLRHMRENYGVVTAMTVSENLCTDGYSEWGGYFNHPYYPTTSNARMPAAGVSNKLDVVMWPWSLMDPLQGYRSVYYASVPNNYLSSTGTTCNAAAAAVDISYFTQQLDLFTDTTGNAYGWFMGGLENAYSWSTYGVEYRRQLEAIRARADNQWLQVLTTGAFAEWYRAAFPTVSPAHSTVETKDWTGGGENVLWYYSPRYRARVVWSASKVAVEDVRAFDDSVAEPHLVDPIPGKTFTVALPPLVDARRWGTIVRGVSTGPAVDESAGAAVRNVVATTSAERARLEYDSDAGHTVMSFGPEGFTIRRTRGAASGTLGDRLLLPAGSPGGWQALLRSASSSVPAGGQPGPLPAGVQTLPDATYSVWLAPNPDGPAGGAVFLRAATGGGSASATVRDGPGTLDEEPMMLSGSGAGSFVLEVIVAPALGSAWQARLAAAQQDPSRFA